jgi:hypothetical protein
MKLFRISLLIAIALLIALPGWAQSSNSFFAGVQLAHNGDLPKTFKGVPGALTGGNNIAGVELGYNAKAWKFVHLAFDGSLDHNAKQNNFFAGAGPELAFGKNTVLRLDALVGLGYQVQKLRNFSIVDAGEGAGAYKLNVSLEHYVSKHFGIRGGVGYLRTYAFGNENNVVGQLAAVWR